MYLLQERHYKYRTLATSELQCRTLQRLKSVLLPQPTRWRVSGWNCSVKMLQPRLTCAKNPRAKEILLRLH